MVDYSGRTSAYRHKHSDWQNYPIDETVERGVRKVFMLDAQWSTCPIEVEEQVKGLWLANELGNDRYMLKHTIEDLLEYSDEFPTDAIVQYLRENGVPDDEMVIIHWWW
jgi:hypothetical protein